MIVAVLGGKGAPGATAVAALLAGAWPANDKPRVIVETDPEGGVLAARWHAAAGVTHDPGLLSLAAARDGSAIERLRQHAQTVADGVELVAGPPGAPQADACLRALGASAPEALLDAPVACLVDCGRLHPASPALPWARAAEHVLLVTRPRLDEVVSLRSSVERLHVAGLAPTLVCVGDGPFAPDDVAEHAGAPLAGVVADDPAGLATLFAHGLGSRRLGRSRLHRSVVELAATLAAPGGPAGDSTVGPEPASDVSSAESPRSAGAESQAIESGVVAR